MATTTERLKALVPDLAFAKLPQPNDHPIFKRYNLKLGPPEKTILPAGHVKEEGRRAIQVDTIWEHNMPVKMRDGITIYTDVYRPTTTDKDIKVPAIMCWSPYGKNGAATELDMMPFRVGVPRDRTSGYEKFEAPDPAEWNLRRYAIVNPDARGAIFSEGKLFAWGSQEAEDIHDTIDWIAKQQWCNGSVCMAGNSWLSVCQVGYASHIPTPHPALKALAPWWGFTDLYRHFLAPGGVPSHHGFVDQFYRCFAGQDEMEDPRTMLQRHPLFDTYWADKADELERISVPIYVQAGFISFHCVGSFATFQRAGTKQKWLRIVPTFEWYELYQSPANDDLQRFFDRFCRGIQNGWETDTPPVRLALIGCEGSLPTVHDRPEASFPLKRQRLTPFYLRPDAKLLTAKPDAQATVSYEGHSLAASADFTFHFSEYTEIAGYPKVKLWMSCLNHDDMDVHVHLSKIDTAGNQLRSMLFPVPVLSSSLPNNGHFKYLGSSWSMRASHLVSRDDTRTSPDGQQIFYAHDKQQKIPPGDVVCLEFTMLPFAMHFAPGEGILFRVAGHDVGSALGFGPLASEAQPMDANVGTHVIHIGTKYDSSIVLPVISGPRN